MGVNTKANDFINDILRQFAVPNTAPAKNEPSNKSIA
jgi:hypothetical protein